MSVPPPPGRADQWGSAPAGPGGPAYPQQPGYPPSGYGAAQPTAGYPPPGYGPAGPGYPPAGLPPGAQVPRTPGTNGFAIAALILGILGGILLSVIFGFVALNQIRRSGQSGRGMAIAGLVLSGLWTVGIAVAVIIAISTSADRDSTGTIAEGGSVSATAVRVGDCLNGLDDLSNITSLPAVPCAEPHEGEVFDVFDLPSGPYPGDAGLESVVEDECNTRLADFSAAAVADPNVGLYYLGPREVNWDAGDREVVCIATTLDGPSTGRIAG